MNERNQKGVAPAEKSNIVIGGAKGRRSVHLKLGVLVAACVVVLAVAGTVTYLATRGVNNSKNPANNTTNTTREKDDAKLTSTQQVDAEVTLGDYASAQKALDDQLAKTSDKAQQATLYQQKAGIAYGDEKYTESLQFARQAESLNPTAGSAGSVADAANALGNKSLALQYYKLQAQRMQPVQNQDTYNRLETKIKSLEGTD